MTFRKAQRSKARARIALIGVSGSGKTYSALLIARGLVGAKGKIAVIDTENGSADLYASLTEYDVATISAPYEPKKYLAIIEEAEKAGYDAIVIDSLSHAWSGDGGLLDMQGKLADRGNSFAAWRNVTPWHNKLVEALITSPAHIIATMRAKAAYEVVEDDRGKKAPKKIGLAPVQREGMEYEFTSVFDIDGQHNATVSKDRTSIFDGTIFKPTVETGKTIREWLESGVESPKVDHQESKPEIKKPDKEKIPAKKAPPSLEGRKKAIWDGYMAIFQGDKDLAKEAILEVVPGKSSKDWEGLDLDTLEADLRDRASFGRSVREDHPEVDDFKGIGPDPEEGAA
ncbi:MAG: hypothetical protein EOM37_18260 [Proteobacteria bacterium]|nr:hypothetical protein [Pseudomonadota bacterium]